MILSLYDDGVEKAEPKRAPPIDNAVIIREKFSVYTYH